MLLFVDLTSLHWLFAGCLCSVSRDLCWRLWLCCIVGLGWATCLFWVVAMIWWVTVCLVVGLICELVVWVGHFCLFVLLIVVLLAIRRLWCLIVLMLGLSYSIWWL